MRKLTYEERASFSKNLVAKKLFLLMQKKESNLALSADVTSCEALLNLVEQCGSEICILKTHIDILEDFTPHFIKKLIALANQFEFLIFEDRKFADIGHTVKQQYQSGIYHIAEWADLINAHTLPGLGIISALSDIGLPKQRGLFLLAEMSSKGNLFTTDYIAKTISMAEEFPDFVAGFISQKKLSTFPGWIYLTPGVQLKEKNDHYDQQYITPKQAIFENKSDIIIVGRGILKSSHYLDAAKKYREEGWAAYCQRLLK